MRGAWFHPFSGIAGDMALGSLLDAGADVDEVRAILGTLAIDRWELTTEDVLRGGIGGTKAHVHLFDSIVVRTAGSVDALLVESPLPDRVRTRARAIFGALAAAEGHLHRKPPSQVHFHEVGSLDAIIDIVGSCAALEVLGIDDVRSGPVTTGLGMVRAAHGTIPNPSPAVVELLQGAPSRGVDSPVELTTPTGAAILAGLVTGWGPLPPMHIEATGFGAGTRELDDRPNLTQVVIGELDAAALDEGQPVVLLETNVDDATGEVLAHTVHALLAAGAHDAWLTPVVMKKGRPGHVVSALADVAVADQVRRVLVAEAGTLGVRGQRMERWTEPRRIDRVEQPDGSARVKVSPGRVKVEHDDAAAIATARGVPLREVVAEIESSWRASRSGDHPTAVGATEPGLHEVIPMHDHDHDHRHTLGHDHDRSHAAEHSHEEGPAEPVDPT